MKNKKRFWTSVIVISILLLISFYFYAYSSFFNGTFRQITWKNSYSGYPNNFERIMNTKEIERAVNRYIENFDEKLEIADIFVYEDSDYYVSIEEVASGKGAMELLVNPYNGLIYPEHGPNMMWNEKYGMHGRMGMTSMHTQNPLFFNEYSGYYQNYNIKKAISLEMATELATEYVTKYVDEALNATKEGHEFYGYYTLHIKNEEQMAGMLSVNYYTGDVWFHDWHGKLIEIISHHDDLGSCKKN